MTRKMNTVGMRSGRLLGAQEEGIYVHCLCDCGNTVKVRRGNFIAGYTQSCGCFQKDRVRATVSTHGLTHTPLYEKWKAMRRRCNNPNHDAYKYYGGKGIKVCAAWEDFTNFYTDMAPTYTEGLTLDRIDNNKDYSPENCRWSTWEENSRNGR